MTDRREKSRRRLAWLLAGVALVLIVTALPGRRAEGEPKGKALPLDKRVLEAEKKRVAAIEKVRPSIVAVYSAGGSGVVIDEEGYALTNFHVTSSKPTMKCGLPDGVSYDAVLVGEDKVGDVALIKLIPKKPGQKFPYAKLGDSDKLRAGDWSLAMGNPFLLSTDFTPTVTFGLISGVHRYQYPAGTLLEYTDCIQIDTSINPGNSGGPLFNMDGELVGINGRGSFEKRGRVNSGVGYAISINQIKNFLGQLRAGMDTDHASLGASMESESEDGALSSIIVRSIIDSDAQRRGLDVGDKLISFAGRPMTTVNQFKNVLGLFPKGWRVPLVYRRENERHEVLVRLMGIQRQELESSGPRPAAARPMPASGPAAKFFTRKAGFANYYFNLQAQRAQLAGFKKSGDFTGLTGNWLLECTGILHTAARGKNIKAAFTILERGAADGKSVKVLADVDGLDYTLEPLNPSEKADNFKQPTESGGLLLALYQYRQLLAFGPKGFVGDFSHGGSEPFYPPPKSEKEKRNYVKQRVECDVLRTKHAGVPAKWYFAQADDKEGRWQKGQMIGFEVTADRDEDPCEVYLSEYRDVRGAGAGRKLPHRIEVRRADKPYVTLTVTDYRLK
jgi:S1-C subfamily serine protease